MLHQAVMIREEDSQSATTLLWIPKFLHKSYLLLYQIKLCLFIMMTCHHS